MPGRSIPVTLFFNYMRKSKGILIVDENHTGLYEKFLQLQSLS